jgi:hypothetical protein
VIGGEQQPFVTSVSGPMVGLGCSDRVLWCATAFCLVGQLSNGRFVMFRHCLVVSSCLFVGRLAVRWANWDVQTGICGEQLHFDWSVSGTMADLVVQRVFFCEKLPFY